jgi:hypothetical protein
MAFYYNNSCGSAVESAGCGCGPKPPCCPPGCRGASAYEIWLECGNTGSKADFIASLKGEKGDQGAQGPQGIQGAQAKPVYPKLPKKFCPNSTSFRLPNHMIEYLMIIGGRTLDCRTA